MKRNDFTIDDVAKHWDETEDYDEINKETYSYWRRFKDGYRLSNIRNGSYILDVCCRTGNGTLFFSKKNKIKAVCLDVSTNMLQIAEERLRKANVDFETKKFDTLDLPLESNIFDGILCFETIEHIPDPDKFLKELYRVLKPGGELLITTPNTLWEVIHQIAAKTKIHHSEGPHRFIPRKELLEAFKKHGFKIKKEETTVLFPIGPKWLITIGEHIESLFKNSLMKYVGLRRIFVCEKV